MPVAFPRGFEEREEKLGGIKDDRPQAPRMNRNLAG